MTPQVSQEWANAIEATLDVYHRVFGNQLVSVYVRGSVPRGLAVAGVSDLDMLGKLGLWVEHSKRFKTRFDMHLRSKVGGLTPPTTQVYEICRLFFKKFSTLRMLDIS